MVRVNSILNQITSGTPSQGDISYYNGTAWVNLVAGTNGYVLKTQGPGANPIWGAGTNANLTGAITSVGAVTSLGSFSSADLRGALTDETGSGAAVFATSPALTTPNIGTPSAGTLTNCTGLPDAGLSLTDVTTNDVSTSKHGFAPKAPNDATKYLDGTGAYSNPYPTGALIPSVASSMSGFLLCDGSSVSMSTYSALWALLNTSLGTATMTIATPCVVTKSSHGLTSGSTIYFTTTGALPTGVSAYTTYWITKINANTFKLSTTYANYVAGTFVNTSGSQSGTHTLISAPFGVASSTNFYLPNLQGKVLGAIGTDSTLSLTARALGQYTGAETHTLTIAEMPAHQHAEYLPGGAGAENGFTYVANQAWSYSGLNKYTDITGGNGSHNNMQPTLFACNYFIRY